MNLLIVDDEFLTIEGILDGVDWSKLSFEQVYTSCTIDKAKELFKEHPIDLMLCDIEMPEGTGLDLLEWVRDSGYKTECIFLTCHEEFFYAKRAIELQSLDYVLKPVPYNELLKKLLKAVDRIEKRNQSEKYQAYGMQWMRDSYNVEEEVDAKGSKFIINEVKKYIREHISEDLSANVLAGKMYITPIYLFRLFKKEEACTLVEYITRERMFLASEMLRTMDLTVSRVSVNVGYNNYCYFSKVFKKIYGKTPSQYKREYQPGWEDAP